VNTATELLRAVMAGIGATAVMDIWAWLMKALFGVPMSDWGLVGRWIGHFPQGKFRHDSIAKATPVRGERRIGWTMHYLTGIAYALLGLAVFGSEWTHMPTPGRAVLLGVAMLVAPFFLMQPGMGYGIAASRTPKPTAARLRSVMNHVAFGLGLYLAWYALALL
jgi:hypothetical protein